MRHPHRIIPRLGPEHYKTYQITAPAQTHWRPATCAEAGCDAHEHGWLTVVPKPSDLYEIATRSGRRYREEPRDGGLVALAFPAGQVCFRAHEHKVPLGRPELYIVRGGDWRPDPRRTEPRRHTRPEHWVEDFAEHQDRLSRLIEGG